MMERATRGSPSSFSLVFESKNHVHREVFVIQTRNSPYLITTNF
jgi:hypothetical protein